MKNEPNTSPRVQRIWKFFASVRLTVVLLLTLAATSIIGTLIPQNEDPAMYFRAYGEFLYRLFNVLGLFDLYHSWWFQILFIVLAVNVTVCSIDRFPAIWKIVFVKNALAGKQRFQKSAGGRTFAVKMPPDRLRAPYTKMISRRFSRHRIENTQNGFVIFAEKGRWVRLGVFAVHASIIILLFGGLIGSMFGFEGFVNIPEGEAADSIRLRKSGQNHPLDFQIRCDDFHVSFYDDHGRMPKEYRSTLTILEKGSPVLTRNIIVNEPLRYRGINIYQSSYGQMPSGPSLSGRIAPRRILLTITSVSTGMVYEQSTAIGEQVELPENLGSFLITEHRESAVFGGQPLGEALVGVLTAKNGSSDEILLPLRFPNFDRMRKGDQVISAALADDEPTAEPDGTEIRYFTGLQVTRDPGVWMVYAGFVIMIIGCYVTFFMSHQQIVVEVTGSAADSRVTVSGTANKNKPGMQERLDRLALLLAGRRSSDAP